MLQWNYNGYIRSPEYGSRKCAENPAGIQGIDDYRHNLCFIAAALVMTVGKYMSYLFVSKMWKLIMDSVDIYLKCVGTFFIPLAIVNIYRKWNTGTRIRASADDGRCG